MTPRKEVRSKRRRGRWRASMAAEKQKLTNREEGWQLRGDSAVCLPSRTRNGGTGRPNLQLKAMQLESMVVEVLSSSSSSCSEEDDSSWCISDSSSSESDDSEEYKRKPPASRVILETDPLTAIMEKTCRCLECNGLVDVTLQTLCLATSIMLSCKNPRCGFVYYSDTPAKVSLESPDNRV
jgi:hypothetical protein